MRSVLSSGGPAMQNILLANMQDIVSPVRKIACQSTPMELQAWAMQVIRGLPSGILEATVHARSPKGNHALRKMWLTIMPSPAAELWLSIPLVGYVVFKPSPTLTVIIVNYTPSALGRSPDSLTDRCLTASPANPIWGQGVLYHNLLF